MNRRYFILMFILMFGIIYNAQLTRVHASQALASKNTSTWLQVNSDGFGDSQNGQIPSLAVFEGYLYAGTQNYTHHPESSEIWRTSNGITWEKVDYRLASGCGALIVYQDYLYAGSWGDVNGGNIWRSQNGTDWTDVITDGFSDINNGIARFAVYSDTLYASTWNSVSGSQIWRTIDGTDWDQFVSSIGNDPDNGGAISSAEFNDYLYWGVGNWTDGGEIWRTDGITITPVITNGFGTTENAAVSSLAVFGNYLYAGVWNSSSIQIWRSSNGTQWSNVVNGDIGGPGTGMANALEVFEDMLYLVSQNDTTGLEVWRTSNGVNWEQVGFSGLGDNNNHLSYFDNAATVFQDKLYIATNNDVSGGEVWQLTLQNLIYLPLLIK